MIHEYLDLKKLSSLSLAAFKFLVAPYGSLVAMAIPLKREGYVLCCGIFCSLYETNCRLMSRM